MKLLLIVTKRKFHVILVQFNTMEIINDRFNDAISLIIIVSFDFVNKKNERFVQENYFANFNVQKTRYVLMTKVPKGFGVFKHEYNV